VRVVVRGSGSSKQVSKSEGQKQRKLGRRRKRKTPEYQRRRRRELEEVGEEEAEQRTNQKKVRQSDRTRSRQDTIEGMAGLFEDAIQEVATQSNGKNIMKSLIPVVR
jgi:flagellum-specific peptidoglycan hydrolase FlgJ